MAPSILSVLGLTCLAVTCLHSGTAFGPPAAPGSGMGQPRYSGSPWLSHPISYERDRLSVPQYPEARAHSRFWPSIDDIEARETPSEKVDHLWKTVWKKVRKVEGNLNRDKFFLQAQNVPVLNRLIAIKIKMEVRKWVGILLGSVQPLRDRFSRVDAAAVAVNNMVENTLKQHRDPRSVIREARKFNCFMRFLFSIATKVIETSEGVTRIAVPVLDSADGMVRFFQAQMIHTCNAAGASLQRFRGAFTAGLGLSSGKDTSSDPVSVDASVDDDSMAEEEFDERCGTKLAAALVDTGSSEGAADGDAGTFTGFGSMHRECGEYLRRVLEALESMRYRMGLTDNPGSDEAVEASVESISQALDSVTSGVDPDHDNEPLLGSDDDTA